MQDTSAYDRSLIRLHQTKLTTTRKIHHLDNAVLLVLDY